MSDFLVELSANPNARKVISALGLPLPMPQKLRRSADPWPSRPLEGRRVLVARGELETHLATWLGAAGATPLVASPTEEVLAAGSPWADAAEAWGRPATAVNPAELSDDFKVDAVVLDATGADTVAALRTLFTTLGPTIRKINRNGRVVILGRPAVEAPSVEASAARAALDGFTRSVAKEVGGKGTTANLITVAKGAEAQAEAALRFFLSERSAFVTAQPIHVGKGKLADRVPFTRPLEGKIAVVTGAGRGIGKATARVLVREGAKVLLLDRPEDAELLAKAAEDVGGVPVAVDITADDAAEKILDAAGGKIDILIHNAGITRDKTLGRMDDARWDLTLDVNLGAVLRVTDALAEHIRPGGRIIGLASIAGIAGNFGQTNYAASKAGVIGFVRAAAPRLAKQGITVNAIAPGFIETRLTAAIPAVTREAGRRLSALSQGGQPTDIAEAIAFLSSPGAAGVTGQVLRVCGGSLIGA